MSGTRKVLAPNATAPKLQTQKNDGTTAAANAANNDPMGFKAYTGWCVAYYLFPDGDGIDLDQDISDNAQTNSETIAAEVDFYASKLAGHYNLTWTNVTATDVAKLTDVHSLESLVIANLSGGNAQ